MFFVVVFTIWTVLHLYAFWRAGSIPAIRRRVSRKLLIVVAVIAWYSYLVAAFVEPLGGWAAWISAAVAGDWLGTLFLLFVCLLVADLVTGFGYWLPQCVPSIRLAALAAASCFP